MGSYGCQWSSAPWHPLRRAVVHRGPYATAERTWFSDGQRFAAHAALGCAAAAGVQSVRMQRWGKQCCTRIGVVVGLLILALAPAQAQDLITKKQVFELASFTTQSGRTLKNVKVGWESYGTLNADKSNAILICHFFSGTSHAAGKYAEAEKVPATGTPSSVPARRSIRPSTSCCLERHAGEPQRRRSQRDDHRSGLDRSRHRQALRHCAASPSSAFATSSRCRRSWSTASASRSCTWLAAPPWAACRPTSGPAAYPDMVGRIMPVIASAEADAGLIDWARHLGRADPARSQMERRRLLRQGAAARRPRASR